MGPVEVNAPVINQDHSGKMYPNHVYKAWDSLDYDIFMMESHTKMNTKHQAYLLKWKNLIESDINSCLFNKAFDLEEK